MMVYTTFFLTYLQLLLGTTLAFSSTSTFATHVITKIHSYSRKRYNNLPFITATSMIRALQSQTSSLESNPSSHQSNPIISKTDIEIPSHDEKLQSTEFTVPYFLLQPPSMSLKDSETMTDNISNRTVHEEDSNLTSLLPQQVGDWLTETLFPIFDRNVEKGVPVETLMGAALVGLGISAVVGKNPTACGIMSIGAMYIAITPGKAGDLLRTVGAATWNSTEYLMHLYTTYTKERAANRIQSKNATDIAVNVTLVEDVTNHEPIASQQQLKDASKQQLEEEFLERIQGITNVPFPTVHTEQHSPIIGKSDSNFLNNQVSMELKYDHTDQSAVDSLSGFRTNDKAIEDEVAMSVEFVTPTVEQRLDSEKTTQHNIPSILKNNTETASSSISINEDDTTFKDTGKFYKTTVAAKKKPKRKIAKSKVESDVIRAMESLAQENDILLQNAHVERSITTVVELNQSILVNNQWSKKVEADESGLSLDEKYRHDAPILDDNVRISDYSRNTKDKESSGEVFFTYIVKQNSETLYNRMISSDLPSPSSTQESISTDDSISSSAIISSAVFPSTDYTTNNHITTSKDTEKGAITAVDKKKPKKKTSKSKVQATVVINDLDEKQLALKNDQPKIPDASLGEDSRDILQDEKLETITANGVHLLDDLSKGIQLQESGLMDDQVRISSRNIENKEPSGEKINLELRPDKVDTRENLTDSPELMPAEVSSSAYEKLSSTDTVVITQEQMIDSSTSPRIEESDSFEISMKLQKKGTSRGDLNIQKPEIVKKIVSVMAVEPKKKRKREGKPKRASDGIDRMIDRTKGTQANFSDEPSTKLYYVKLTVPELKEKLRTYGLKVTGVKAELLNRLYSYEARSYESKS